LPGTAARINYVLLNRLDPNAVVFPDEGSQAFRVGAGGLPGNSSSAQACFQMNNAETIWTAAAVNQCSSQVSTIVTAALCGLDTRFESSAPSACISIPGVDTLETIYQPDTDTAAWDAYADYPGSGRRVITVPVVDSVSGSASMTVLGFRQFLLIPAEGTSALAPGDLSGRFAAMYIGSVAPVTQGRFDGCQQAAGPGKVVLHQ
jgi:hypothetical protein